MYSIHEIVHVPLAGDGGVHAPLAGEGGVPVLLAGDEANRI